MSNKSGSEVLKIVIKREGCKISVEAIVKSCGWNVYLRDIKNVKEVRGAEYITDDLGTKLIPGANGKVEVML